VSVIVNDSKLGAFYSKNKSIKNIYKGVLYAFRKAYKEVLHAPINSQHSLMILPTFIGVPLNNFLLRAHQTHHKTPAINVCGLVEVLKHIHKSSQEGMGSPKIAL
jgi:hypothetical protein